MADQVRESTVPGLASDSSQSSSSTAGSSVHAGHHGRPVSWLAVTLILAGFLAGGLGLMLGPYWWLFWTGAGVAGAGTLLAAATNIMDDWY